MIGLFQTSSKTLALLLSFLFRMEVTELKPNGQFFTTEVGTRFIISKEYNNIKNIVYKRTTSLEMQQNSNLGNGISRSYAVHRGLSNFGGPLRYDIIGINKVKVASYFVGMLIPTALVVADILSNNVDMAY